MNWDHEASARKDRIRTAAIPYRSNSLDALEISCIARYFKM